MKIDERRSEIIEYLKGAENDIVTITDISEIVRASIGTIKNDLKALSLMYPILLIRGINGGVRLVEEKKLSNLITIISSCVDANFKEYCRRVFSSGFIPVCSTLYFSAFIETKDLNDQKIQLFEQFIIDNSSEIWVVGEKKTLNERLNYALESKKPIKFYDENEILYEN